MSELSKKVDAGIKRLKLYEPPGGYYLAFSGGKDSVTIKALADMAGVKYSAHYRITTVDPPELVRFIRDKFPDVHRDPAWYAPDYKNKKLAGKQITMWNLIPEKLMPPTRIARYCCDWIKEDGGADTIAITGVRWAESVNRSKNQGPVVVHGAAGEKPMNGQESLFEETDDFKTADRFDSSLILMNDNAENRKVVDHCLRKHKITVNPIVEWTEADVWEFIKAENVPYCELYDCGFKRLGCVCCPMASQEERLREFELWPKLKIAYLNAFEKMIKRRLERGKTAGNWENGVYEAVMKWWLELGD